MSRKLTRRVVRDRFSGIIQIGACALDSLLEYEDKLGHLERVEGWAADVYYAGYVEGFGSVAICTGYDPIGRLDPPYSLVSEYKRLGDMVGDVYPIGTPDYVDNRKALRRCLLDQFLQEVVYGIQQ